MFKTKKTTSLVMAFFIMLLCMTAISPIASAEAAKTVSVNVADTYDGKYWALSGTYEHGTPFMWKNDTSTLINTNTQMRYEVTVEQAGYYELSFDYLSLYAASDATNGNRNVYFRVMVGDETIVNIQKLPLTATAASTSSTVMNNAEAYTCPTLIPLKEGSNIVKFCVFGGADAEKAGERNNACQVAVRTTDSFSLSLVKPTLSIDVANTVDGKYWAFSGTYEHGTPFMWNNATSTLINTNTQMRYGVTAEQAGYYELSFDYLSAYAANDPTYGNRNVYFRVMVGDETVIDIQKLPLTVNAASTSSTAMNNAVSYTCPTLIPLKAGENVVKICIYQGTQTVDGVQSSSLPMAVRTTDSFLLTLQRPIITIHASDFSNSSGFGAKISGEDPQDGDKLSFGNEAIFYTVNTDQEGYYDVSADVSTGNAVTYLTVATTEPAGVTTNVLTKKVQDKTAFNTGHDKDMPTYPIGTGLYLKKGQNTIVVTSDNWTRLESLHFAYSEDQNVSGYKELALVPLAYAKTLESAKTPTSGIDKYRYGFAKTYPGRNQGTEFVLDLVPGTYKVSMRSRNTLEGTAALDVNGERVVSGVTVGTGYQASVVLSESVSVAQAGPCTFKVVNETCDDAIFCGILVEKVGEYVGPSVDDEIPSIENGVYQKTLETPADLKDGAYTLKIYSERALSYGLSSDVTVPDSGAVNVYVNDVKQIENKETATSQNALLGTVTLARGENEIKIESASGDTVLNGIALQVADSFANGTMQISFAEDSTIPAKNITNYIDGSAVFMADDYAEFDFYSEKERMVLMSFDYAAKRSTSLYNVAVNGETQIQNAGLDYTGDKNNWVYQNVMMADALVIPAGAGTIRFSLAYDQVYMKNMTLYAPENEVMISDLAVVNAAGGRIPYTWEDGTVGRGAVTLWRFGVPQQKEMRLIVAQYQNKELVSVEEAIVDPMQAADGKKQTVYTNPITLKAGGVLKAFLWDGTTFAPVQAEVMHEALPEIFTEEDVNALKQTAVSYELSQNVKKNETEYYGDYSDGVIKSIFYDGYNNTKVYAYMGIPESSEKVPAVVCVHGGGGTAYKEWVKMWNDRGIAAIAMDLYSGGPEAYVSGTGTNAGNNMQKHPYAGIKPFEDFSGLENGKASGMYQSVANVMYAYNLLASMPEIDADKIGITGISWGGVTTTTVIGVDDRFCFAVPVYGCGYLDECRTYFSTDFFQKANATLAWDPANFSVKSDIPVMFINSDADRHFSLNATTNTAAVTKNGFMSIRNGLAHSHVHGYDIDQIYTFAEDIFHSGKDNFMRIESANVINRAFSATCALPEGVTASSATVYYITEANLPWTGAHGGVEAGGIAWKTVNGTVNGSSISASLPENATFAYVTVTDQTGNMISSGLLDCSAQ